MSARGSRTAERAIAVDRTQARRFMLQATGLGGAFPDVATALDHLGFVQIDPINVCGRMHDLVLRNRVARYREGALMAHLHPEAGERAALEQFVPGAGILAAFPFSAWPYLLANMRARSRQPHGHSGRLDRAERRLARRVLEEIASRGALCPEDIDHDGRAQCGWGTNARAVKVLLEKLFVHGEVLVAGRRAYRRVYDIPERVLPGATLAARPATVAQCRRWRLLARLRQRRLVRLGAADLALVRTAVQAVSVPDCPRLYCLREDLPLLHSATEPVGGPWLLAPLDPVIYDRVLSSKLWGFDYTWEVYTPPALRRRGYYALPLLSGTEIVGHVDPKADRGAGRLRVVSRQVRRGYRSSEAVRELAAFLGLRV